MTMESFRSRIESKTGHKFRWAPSLGALKIEYKFSAGEYLRIAFLPFLPNIGHAQ